MKIEIDQSGKIENTGKDTIIAFSNGSFGSISISAKDKREIQRIFRKIGKPRVFVYRVFAVLIFLLINPAPFRQTPHLLDRNYININLLVDTKVRNYLKGAGQSIFDAAK
ncbi:hypothetical protein L6267_01100 [Candidatus Parcubacteria bacterium]|nr:hypothetical protein [Candidatus Parcubacteria bacterium]